MAVFAVIYNTKDTERLKEVERLINHYDVFVHPHENLWLIDCYGDPVGIKNYLADAVSVSGSLFVFEVNKEWAALNSPTIYNWLNERRDSDY